LDWMIDKRRGLAARYDAVFADMPFIRPPYVPEYTEHTYQSYCIRVEDGCPTSRDDIMQSLLDKGITTRRGVMAIHQEEAYRGSVADHALPETDKATAQTILLPLYPTMSVAEQDYVIENLGRCVGVS